MAPHTAFTDQLGKTITLDHTPRRIISLVPSQTELLHALGLQDEVVGITKFCVHPSEWFRSKTRIGGTKNIKLDAIRDLQPDLVLANKEENNKEQVEALSLHYPVWTSDIKTLSDAIAMIRSVGALTGRGPQGESLAAEIERRFAGLQAPAPPKDGYQPHKTPVTAYFIWRNPWMAAGGDTFIHDMLQRCGLINLFQDQDRYPSIELAALSGSGCDLVLLSSEPYPFRVQHIGEIRTVLPGAAVHLVDGEMFSWYGSRLLHAPAYFSRLQESLISSGT
jgi:ABC-type Fe3+-hydroxamate transport system substrate-binding protein